MQIPFYKTRNVRETIQLGSNLAKILMPGDALFFFGNLGAGKTHFIKGVAQGLGIKEIIKSPTYAFVKSYTFKKEIFYHYDLYRAHDTHGLEALGIFESLENPRSIHAIEWSEHLNGKFPERRLEITMEAHDDCHTIRIHRVDPEAASLSAVPSFYKRFDTHAVIQKHCAQVARAAMAIAEAMMRLFKIVDVDLLCAAALSHDVMKLQKKHAEAMADFLVEQGYPKTAALVRLHNVTALLERPKAFDTVEKKILYYADKRVAHDKIVSVQERLEEGRKRWLKKGAPPLKYTSLEVDRAVLKLERELFKGLDIKPEDI
ncbi:tRNA (adenosine(37)-N6)-threonylcarbamoyltransferase complex ATPase subunit type 1 TsaE [Candidatus Peregrinibacteria bacterium]|nr:tRNA (adenosine(37)-N6)-threonylcarbamoyltransferase complex ATPase subunit type 1 TsaE [Candidatus Peregrinibacteria bacterium]